MLARWFLLREVVVASLQEGLHRLPSVEHRAAELLAVQQQMRSSHVGVRLIERLPPLHRAWHLPELFPEVLAYTPEEFEDAQDYLGIQREAARTGIRVTLSEDDEQC